MANTTNLDLVKPAGTDHALISVLNSNSDKIDAFAGQTNDSLAAEQNGLAYIVGNTNTTGGTLAVGQFVYVKGHSTIPEGLRKVTSSISANGSITTSNTDACSEGGLNALNGKIATKQISITKESTFSGVFDVIRSGNVCVLYIDLSYTGGTSNAWVTIGTLAASDIPLKETRNLIMSAGSYQSFRVKTDGQIQIYSLGNGGYTGQLVYIV